MRNNIWLVVIITILSVTNLISQGRVTGNFVMEGQYYQQDSSIGTTEFPKEVAAQGYLGTRVAPEYGIRRCDIAARVEGPANRGCVSPECAIGDGRS